MQEEVKSVTRFNECFSLFNHLKTVLYTQC